MAETLADAVVVGGGILGMSLAYELARRMMRVMLLESNTLAGGASGSGFAWINAASKDEDEGYHRLNAAGMAAYDTQAFEWGAAQIGLHGGGSLAWANPDDGAAQEKLRQRSAILQRWGYPAALLSGREMQTLEPHIPFAEAALGLFAPSECWLDTPRCIRFLAGEFQKRKGIIRQYSPAIQFSRGITQKINSVQTIDSTISTPILILAAGLQIPALVEKAAGNPESVKCVPIHADAGLLIEASADSVSNGIHRVLYPPASDGLHLRPTISGGVLFGSDDSDNSVKLQSHTQTLSGGNVPLDISAALYNRVDRALPALFSNRGASQCAARTCLRPMPADARPIIGGVPGIEGVFVLAAHSGVTLAPVLAQALADEICNSRLPPELSLYRPERFLNVRSS